MKGDDIKLTMVVYIGHTKYILFLSYV